MSEKKSSGHDRTRNWTIVGYPDSLPENWREILDDAHIEWIESPLHQFDTNATGELKKAHYHILLMFGGVKSYEQVCEFISPLHCPIPEKCHNSKAMVRYMAHLDNPEKYQYSPSEIIPHGGVDLAELLRPSSSERYSYVKEMLSWCRDNNIIEFQDLIDYAMEYHFDDWFPCLCDNSSVLLNSYLKSARHRSS